MYATVADVVTRYKPILTMMGTGSLQVTSTDIASVYVFDAEGVVDAYLSIRYVTPMSAPIPPIVTMIAADLAIFNLLAEKLTNIPEFMDKRYNRCMSMLEHLRDGKMLLPASYSIVASEGDDFAWSPNMTYHATFDPTLPFYDQVPDLLRVSAQRAIRQADYDALNEGGFIVELP